MSKRLAALHRMRAELSRRLAEVDEEIAAAMADSEEAPEAHATARRKPTGPTLRIPEGPPPTELDQRRAGAALRDLGYRSKPAPRRA